MFHGIKMRSARSKNRDWVIYENGINLIASINLVLCNFEMANPCSVPKWLIIIINKADTNMSDMI